MRALHHPAAPRWILLLGILLGLCSLPAGLVIDDHVLRMHLSGRWLFPEPGPLLSLFGFVPADPALRQQMMDLGVLPWWSDPQLHMGFFRPVSALTHMLDQALWPDTIWVQHLHSVLWWGLSITGVGGLLRRVHGAGAVAAAGLLLFVLEDAHAWPIWWLSNRNALVALAFGALSARAFIAWRQGGGGPALAASLLALSASLLAGESGIGTLAWLAAWQLTLDQGPLGRRLLALAPAAGVVVLWRLGWSALGFGAVGSGLYIDPAGEPLRFLGALTERLPILSLGQWTQAPIDIFAFAPPELRRLMQGAGLLTLLALGLWLRPLLRERPEARFYALAFLLALVPACATFPMARLLSFASVSAAGLLALQAERAGWLSREPPTRRSWGTGAMLLLHGPLSALMLVALIVGGPQGLRYMLAQGQAQVARDPAPELLIVVNGDSLLTSYLLLDPTVARLPSRLALLAPAGAPVQATRQDDRTLELDVPAGWLWAPKDQLIRDPRTPFSVGQRITLPDLQVEILALLPDGTPSRVRFRFREPLDSSAYHLVGFDGGGFAPLSLAVGQTRTLPGLVR